jgi:hypothetical protein
MQQHKVLVVVCCLSALLGLSHGRLVSTQESNRYFQGKNASNDEMIDVIVGYKSTANVASLSSSSSTGTTLYTRPISTRTNTAAARIPASELTTLVQNNPDVEYVERDTLKHLYSEEYIWGINAVQGGFRNSIPTPTSKDCFKVCVVDSGFLLGHPDLVSATGSNG